jgi:hypothetical protein
MIELTISIFIFSCFRRMDINCDEIIVEDLKILYEGGDLIVESPWLYAPYGLLTLHDKGYDVFDFIFKSFVDSFENVNAFEQKLSEIDETIYNILAKQHVSLNYMDCIRRSYDQSGKPAGGFHPYFRLKTDGCTFLDFDNNIFTPTRLNARQATVKISMKANSVVVAENGNLYINWVPICMKIVPKCRLVYIETEKFFESQTPAISV